MAEFTVYDDTEDGEPEDVLIQQPQSSPQQQSPTLDYRTPGTRPPAAMPVRHRTPPYSNITRGASALHALAIMAIMAGVFSCIGRIMLGAKAIFIARGEPDWEIGLVSIASGLISLLAFLIVAAILNFLAGIGMAVRDVAINSFKR